MSPGGLWTPPRRPLLHEQSAIEIGDKIRDLSLCGPSKCTQLSSAQKIRKLCNFSRANRSHSHAALYIKLTLAQSDEAVIPGNRFTAAAEVALPPDTHVYAPEVKGYKPIQLIVEASPDLKLLPVRCPEMLSAPEIWCLLGCASNATGKEKDLRMRFVISRLNHVGEGIRG